jgi:hypothetical protein
MLAKSGERRVAVRKNLNNRFEVQKILKELKIPRQDWPERIG